MRCTEGEMEVEWRWRRISDAEGKLVREESTEVRTRKAAEEVERLRTGEKEDAVVVRGVNESPSWGPALT